MWQGAFRAFLGLTLGVSWEVSGPAKSRILLGGTVRPTGAWFGEVTGSWCLRRAEETRVPSRWLARWMLLTS